MAIVAGIAASSGLIMATEPPRRPNVILIMTDDQGWGDFSFHGNPVLKTPNLDQLAARGIELTQFYVSPVCSPTRASLMTGRYNYRTGAIDTYLGRSSMAPDETTLAEMVAAAGYKTGIFGKWHLGDNYPTRPIDQGFSRALVHRGGGIGQPSDPPGNSYFNPALLDNGRPVESKGYCSDVFTDAAMEFIGQHRDTPFFVYLAFNCPHTPLEVPAEYHRRYAGQGLDETTAKIYGMVSNIDDNLARLLARLTELKLDEHTIVVFLTDNGPQQRRFNGVLRDLKGSVYEGGIRTPCLVSWPGHFAAGRKVEQLSAHIDLAPTLLAACGIAPPAEVKFDGVNLLPALVGDAPVAPERLLYFQWHRGDVPEKNRNCAVRGPRYKLVQGQGRGEHGDFQPKWELFDIAADPSEQQNLAESQPEVVAELKAAYERWLADVSETRGFPVPKIIVGTEHENPVTLTRQDWRGPQAGWGKEGVGHWTVVAAKAGQYDVTVRLSAIKVNSIIRLQIGKADLRAPLAAGADRHVFKGLQLAAGEQLVEAWREQDKSRSGAHYVDIEWQRK